MLFSAADPPATSEPPLWTDVVSAIAGSVSAASAAVAAASAILTVAIAGVAAYYAWRQVKGAREQLDEARDLRKEQAQPYVVVHAEPTPGSDYTIDIVVRNYGQTGAHDVRITSTPELQRSDVPDEPQNVAIPKLPFLAPGQEWRTFWDSGLERLDGDLPRRYELIAYYRGRDGVIQETPSVLDWQVFQNRMWAAERKTIADVAHGVGQIASTLGRIERGDKIIKVATYDGADRDAARQAARAEHQRVVGRYEERQRRATELPDRGQPGASGWRETSLWF